LDNSNSSYTNNITNEDKYAICLESEEDWCIADTMSLLRGFMGQHKRCGCNLDANFMADAGDIVSKNEMAIEETEQTGQVYLHLNSIMP
jgi:hypothetical protein